MITNNSTNLLKTLLIIMKLILLIPLIDYNKKEIIPEVQRIGTYEIFFEKYENYCSLFEPKHPITRPRKEVVEKLEVEIL